jgi:hypothetical protein
MNCGTKYLRRLLPILILVMAGSFRFAPLEQNEEYSIKAAFIYKFTNYIEWGNQLQGDEFIIGVAGNSPIKGQLDEIARTHTVNSKKITVRQFSKPEEIGACHILFVPEKTSLSLDDILTRTNGKGTLVVSEKDGYAAKGAGINFVEIENRLKFEANPKAINAAGLKASSQLLKLAIIVE